MRNASDRLMDCPDCDSPVSARAPSCPHCGCPFASEVPVVRGRSGIWDGVNLGCGMFIVLPLIIIGLIMLCCISGVLIAE